METIRTILVIDDDAVALQATSAMLAAAGEAVSATAWPGVEEFRQLTQTAPDVIVLAVSGATVDAPQICHHINMLTPTTLLILTLAAAVAPETRAACLEAGAAGYLLSPFNVREFHAALLAWHAESRQAKLNNATRKLQVLFDILPVGISILDGQRNMLLTNPALAEILDLNLLELHRDAYRQRTYLRPDRSPLPPHEFPSVRAFQEQRAIEPTIIGIRKEDGTEIWTNISAAPLPFTDWKVVITTTDVTEVIRMKEALQESEARFRLIFDHTFDAIIVIDDTGQFVDVNATACELLGYAKAEFLTLHTADIHPPEDVARVQAAVDKAFAQDVPYLLETTLRGKIGEAIPVEAGGVHVKILGRDVVIKSFRDLTERKLAEASRQRENEFLQHFSGIRKPTSVTAELLGVIPLQRAAVNIFEELSARYVALLKLALEEQTYKVEHHVSEKLRALAEELGGCNAGPRDVIDLHVSAFQTLLQGIPAPQTNLYGDIGRLILLELMGYLVSYYRRHAAGGKRVPLSDLTRPEGGRRE